MVPIVDVPETGAPPARRRRVVLSGPLDTAAAVQLSAELMELDGDSADDVELVINSEGGRLADVLGPLDVIASMRAHVGTVCMGRASGTAAVLLACGTGARRAGPHATMSLRCAGPELLEGPAAILDVRLAGIRRDPRHAAMQIRQRERVYARVFAGQPMALRTRPCLVAGLLGAFGYRPGFPVAEFPADVLFEFVAQACRRRRCA